MRSQTTPDVENPTNTPLLDADYGYEPSLDASLPSQPQENDQQPTKPILLLISGLLAIGLLAALIVGNVHIHTQNNDDVPLHERMDPVKQGVSDKSFKLPADSPSFSWENDMLNYQAPAFHFYPGENWMNGKNVMFRYTHLSFLSDQYLQPLYLILRTFQTKKIP